VTERDRTRRRSGVLLPVSSLPGPDGIGNLGEHSVRWLDWLHRADVAIWQLLPLGPLGWGDSPYSSLSSFAGNPLLVSPDALARDGWISDEVLGSRPTDDSAQVDYAGAARWTQRCLRAAWRRLPDASLDQRHRFERFREAPEQAFWLDDWTLFAALRAELEERCWLDWPREIRSREPEALAVARARLSKEIEYQTFVQFLFFDQLAAVRQQARRLGIELWGDLPFYPALDSADVWSHPELFELAPSGRPLRVAGVPPDAFTETGQLWGNPLYRWPQMAADGYRWWIARAEANLRLADRLRLDHFRGFASYWAVPAEARTAAEGTWESGPEDDLFAAIRQALGDLPFIAEDLGRITDAVRSLRRRVALPGMRVLQFAFDTPGSEHLPHQLPADVVVYTGTHDNDTTRGWFDGLSGRERQRVLDYVGGTEDDVHWSLLRAAWVSSAEIAIAPVQDLLGLDSGARLNVPGRSSDQWSWRLTDLPDNRLAERLARLIDVSDRRPPPSSLTEHP